LSWYKGQSERTRLAGPKPDEEKELLAEWKKSK
jgi:hypothetical protein